MGGNGSWSNWRDWSWRESALLPERDEFVFSHPAGLAVFEGQLLPAKKGFGDEGDAAGGERSRFLRRVGFGGDRAEGAGAPGDHGRGVGGGAVALPAERGRDGEEQSEREQGQGRGGEEARAMAVGAGDEGGEGEGGEPRGGNQEALPRGGGRELGERLAGGRAQERGERGGGEAGFFGYVGEVPADGGVRGILDKGGGGVRGGFAGLVLLREREGEVVVRGPVGGGFREGVAPGFFGGGEFAGGIVRGGLGGAEWLRKDEGEEEEGGERKEVAREEEAQGIEAGDAVGGEGGLGAGDPIGGEIGLGAVEGAVAFEPEGGPGGVGERGGGRGGVAELPEDGGVVLPGEEELSVER